MGLTNEQRVSDIKNLINGVCDEYSLRELRDHAEHMLDQLRAEKEQSQRKALEKAYRGKYLLIYGTMYNGPIATENKADFKLVHVKQISLVGRGFFRCHAKVVHVVYDDEFNIVKNLSASTYGSCEIEYIDDKQFALHMSDISEILTKKEVDSIIAKAIKNQTKLLKGWDR